MHLKAFEVRNYRAFVEPARVELRPLTLLFGYNNVGKSALARVLPLLRDSSQGHRGLPLNLESPAVRGAELTDLRSHQTGRRTIELSLEPEPTESLPASRIHLVFQDLPERRQHVIESFKIETNTGDQALEGKLVPSGEEEGRLLYDLRFGEGTAKRVAMKWHGLIPSVDKAPGDELRQELILLGNYSFVLSDLTGMLWVGAVRSTQPRFAKFPRVKPETISWDGKGAADALAWDKQYGDGQLFTAVSSWYGKHAGVPLDVSIRADEYALTTGTHQVNLSDTGEGLTQVLPVLVAGAMTAHRAAHQLPSLLVIEQPELHLHPAAHAPLAEYFCNSAATHPESRMLIETHSENFLFGVQLAVAQGLLDPARVLIYWVQQDDQGASTLTPIQMDADGRPDFWPRGVFTEEVELGKRLLEVRRKKRAP